MRVNLNLFLIRGRNTHKLTQSAAYGVHGSQLLPGVSVRLIFLSCVPAVLSIIAPHYIQGPPAHRHPGSQASHRHWTNKGPAIRLRIPPAKQTAFVQCTQST